MLKKKKNCTSYRYLRNCITNPAVVSPVAAAAIINSLKTMKLESINDIITRDKQPNSVKARLRKRKTNEICDKKYDSFA